MTLTPPPVRPTVPPSNAPSKWRVAWASLLGKPTSLTEAGLTIAGVLAGPLEVRRTGGPPLVLQRNENTAAVRTMLELRRNGATKGFLALDGSDRIAVLHSDGTTVLMYLELSGIVNALDRFKAPHLEATTDVKTPKVLDATGTQVVGAQQPAIADGVATSGSAGGGSSVSGATPATLDDVGGAYAYADGAYVLAGDAHGTAATALTKVNAALAALRAHGLIHT